MKSFAITPSEAELQALERDLHFYPTVNSSPKALTMAQIEGFNARGYVTPLQIYSPTEIRGIREYFDDLLKRVVAAGGNSYSISSAHMKYGPVHDIMTNPTIVNYVSDLLGENVIGWGAHFFCKMPGDGKAVAWHQDASYWPLSPSKAVTVWLAIDDADEENAGDRLPSVVHPATFKDRGHALVDAGFARLSLLGPCKVQDIAALATRRQLLPSGPQSRSEFESSFELFR